MRAAEILFLTVLLPALAMTPSAAAGNSITLGCACRVVLTPHIAGVTEMSYRNMAEIVAQEVLQIHQGGGAISAPLQDMQLCLLQ